MYDVQQPQYVVEWLYAQKSVDVHIIMADDNMHGCMHLLRKSFIQEIRVINPFSKQANKVATPVVVDSYKAIADAVYHQPSVLQLEAQANMHIR